MEAVWKKAALYALEQSQDVNALCLQRIPSHMWETPNLLREPAELQTLVICPQLTQHKPENESPLDSSFNLNIFLKAIHLVQHA